jgi:hypothetical protein
MPTNLMHGPGDNYHPEHSYVPAALSAALTCKPNKRNDPIFGRPLGQKGQRIQNESSRRSPTG